MAVHKKFPLRKLVLLAIASGLAIALWQTFRSGAEAEPPANAFFTVKRGDLLISVTEDGALKAVSEISIRNQLEGISRIISLVPEGTHVRKGDLLVELDSSELRTKINTQEVTYQDNLFLYLQAQENLKIQKSIIESNIKQAELQVEFAESDLEKYKEGDAPLQIKNSEGRISLLAEDVRTAEERYLRTVELEKKGNATKSEVEADRLSLRRKKIQLDQSQENLRLTIKFDQPNTIRMLESNVQQAKDELLRLKQRSAAEIAQAEADLRTSKAALDFMESALNQQKRQLQNAKIVAPQDGLVVYASLSQFNRGEGRMEEGRPRRGDGGGFDSSSFSFEGRGRRGERGGERGGRGRGRGSGGGGEGGSSYSSSGFGPSGSSGSMGSGGGSSLASLSSSSLFSSGGQSSSAGSGVSGSQTSSSVGGPSSSAGSAASSGGSSGSSSGGRSSGGSIASAGSSGSSGARRQGSSSSSSSRRGTSGASSGRSSGAGLASASSGRGTSIGTSSESSSIGSGTSSSLGSSSSSTLGSSSSQISYGPPELASSTRSSFSPQSSFDPSSFFMFGGPVVLEEGVQVRQRQELIKLPDVSHMLAEVKIHESRVRQVRPGMRAYIKVETLPGQRFKGSVRKVGILPDSQTAWANPDLKLYATEVLVEDDLPELRPGVSARAEIVITNLANVLSVPIQAVALQQGQHVCYVKHGRGTVPVNVTVGWFNDRFIEVTSGLKEGDRILLAPRTETVVTEEPSAETNQPNAIDPTAAPFDPNNSGARFDDPRSQGFRGNPNGAEFGGTPQTESGPGMGRGQGRRGRRGAENGFDAPQSPRNP